MHEPQEKLENTNSPQENLENKNNINETQKSTKNKESINEVKEDSKKQLEERENRKSKVRVRITYLAATFLFIGGGIFIIYLIYRDMVDSALTLFNTLLPIASGFVAYWFAGRGSGGNTNPNK